MSSEGTEAASYTTQIAAIAKDESDRIGVRLEALLVELESVRAEKRKIDSVLKALNGSVAKSGPKPKKQGYVFKPSAAKREEALAFITDNESEITSTKLREHLNVSGSYAASILGLFRDEGLVRLAATQGSLKVYRSQVYS